MRIVPATLALLALTASLSACGLRGDLKRADPLWGDPALDGPTDPRVIRQLEEQARLEKEQKEAEERAEAARAEAEAQAQATRPDATSSPDASSSNDAN